MKFSKSQRNSSKMSAFVFIFENLTKYVPLEKIAAIILMLLTNFWFCNSESLPLYAQLYCLKCMVADNTFIDWNKVICLWSYYREFESKIFSHEFHLAHICGQRPVWSLFIRKFHIIISKFLGLDVSGCRTSDFYSHNLQCPELRTGFLSGQ